jgi:zinc protease
MVNSFISRKDLESEFSVVRNEFERGENSPGSVLYKRMLPAHLSMAQLWPLNHWGKVLTLKARRSSGSRPSIATTTSRTMPCSFIAGRIDEQKTLELVREAFLKIPKPTRVLRSTYTKEPTPGR